MNDCFYSKDRSQALFFLFVDRVDRSVILPMKHGRSNSRAVDVGLQSCSSNHHSFCLKPTQLTKQPE